MSHYPEKVKESIEATLANQVPSFTKRSGEAMVEKFFSCKTQPDFPLTFVPPMVRPVSASGDLGEPELLSYVVEKIDNPLVLLAPGGGGKTTAMASLWIQKQLSSTAQGAIFLSLSHLKEFQQLNKSPVDQMISANVFGMNDELRRQTLEERPQLLVMLDGLNELSEDVRGSASDIADNLKRMASEYFRSGFGNKTQRRLIIGSRPQENAHSEAILPRLTGFSHYQLCPLDTEQAFEILREALKYYQTDEKLVDELVERIKLAVRPELLANPLNLSLLIQGLPYLKKRMDGLKPGVSLTRADLLEVALGVILAGDAQRDLGRNDHHYFNGDGEKIQFALHLFAAVLLRKADGAASLDQKTLIEGLEDIGDEGQWTTSEKERDVLRRIKKSPRDFVKALSDLRLVIVTSGQFSFQHDVWRDYMAATLMVNSGWKKGKVDFASVSRPAWQDAVLLATELTGGCVDPLIQTMGNAKESSYVRRRAAQVWEQTDDTNNIDVVLNLYDVKDSIIWDEVGHIIRNRAAKDANINRRIQSKCVQFFQSPHWETRVKAIHVANGLGKLCGEKIKRELCRILGDTKEAAIIRERAIKAALYLQDDAEIAELIEHCGFSEHSRVREAAWHSIWAQNAFTRDFDAIRRTQQLTKEFCEGKSWEEQFTLLRTVAQQSLSSWDTHYITDAFASLSNNDVNESTMKWYLVCFLQSNRNHPVLSDDDLDRIVESRGEDTFTQQEVNRLLLLKNRKPLPLKKRDPSPEIDEFTWGTWVDGMKKQKELSGNIYATYDDSLWLLSLLRRSLNLSEEGKDKLIDKLEEISGRKALPQDEESHMEKLAASLFIMKTRIVDERIRALRHQYIFNEDAHTRSRCSSMIRMFSSEEEERAFKNILCDHKQDEYIRWKCGAALLYYSKNPDIIWILSTMLKDKSGLTRGYACDLTVSIGAVNAGHITYRLEIEELLVSHLNIEQDPYVIARLIRALGKLGTLESKKALEKLLAKSPHTDTLTRLGFIKDLANRSIQSIEKAVD